MHFCLCSLVLSVIALQAITAAGPQKVKIDPGKVADCVLKYQKNELAKKYDTPTLTAKCERILAWPTDAAQKRAKGGVHKPKQTPKQEEYYNSLKRKAKNRRGKRQTTPPQRKEYRCMTDEERNNYHNAIKALIETKIDGKSLFTIIAEYHDPEYAPEAHGCDSFPPWHREYLLQYETALQEQVPDTILTLAYWDSCLDNNLPEKADSIIFTAAFAGPGQGDVNSGPQATYAEAPTVAGAGCVLNHVCRQVKLSTSSFYDESIFDFVKSATHFSDLSACKNPYFEGEHGNIHMCFGPGSHMEKIATAAFDMLFYMHHCFVDYLWEMFRQLKQTRDQRATEYPATSCYADCNPQNPMIPLNKTLTDLKIIAGMSNGYTDTYYQYQKHPVCNAALSDCDPPSKHLFCDKKSGKCVSKVKPGGSCKGFANTPICYESTCSRGKCVQAGGGSVLDVLG